MLRCPTALLCAAGSTPWFDPLQRYDFPRERLAARAQPPLFAYVPGLDGTSGSPFVQWPALAEAGYEIRVQDARAACAAPASFDATVDEVTTFLRARASPTLLMGESYGAVVAAAAALRSPELVAGLILVNPATAYGQLAELQSDAALLARAPEPLFPAASFALLGRKTFDLGMLGAAVRDLVVERKLEALRASDPPLARYYDAALAELTAQIATLPPREFMLARLAHLETGCAAVERGLASVAPPVLVIAGTADRLLQSEAEARRLQALLGPARCAVHLVDGAGHAGTLDQRIELASVVQRWVAVAEVPITKK